MSEKNTKKIKILFILHNLSGGGAERVVVDFLNHYDRNKYQCKLLLNSVKGDYLDKISLSDLIIEKNYSLKHRLALFFSNILFKLYNSKYCRPFKNKIKKIFFNKAVINSQKIAYSMGITDTTAKFEERLFNYLISYVAEKIRYGIYSYKPQFIITHLIESASIYAYIIKTTSPNLFSTAKWIAVEHNNTWMRAIDLYSDENERRFWNKITTFVYSSADKVVTVSSGVKDGLIKNYHIPNDKIKIIYNPINVKQIQSTCAIKPVKPFILAAGRLHPQKKFDLLIKAYAQIADDITQDLIILGTGKEKDALSALIRQLHLEKRVHLPGFQKNLWGYMKAASCFVLSSSYEGLSLVLMEAMATGCPVVSFDCDYGPNELITHKVNGLLVPQKDIGALAKKIKQLLQDPILAKRLSENGISAICAYEPQKHIQIYEALFYSIIEN